MREDIAIFWFRQDLRLSDNPALTEAAKHKVVMPIYIMDNYNAHAHSMGATSRCWLYYSLQSLNTSLGGELSIYQGNPVEILTDIAKRHDIRTIYWNRCYEPWRRSRDLKIKKYLHVKNIKVESTNGSLLWEPWTIKKNDNTHNMIPIVKHAIFKRFNLNALSAQSNFCELFFISLQRGFCGIGVPLFTGLGCKPYTHNIF